MIDDDIKFFRQNFSASSLSDFTDTPRKQAQPDFKSNVLYVPQPRKYGRDEFQRKDNRTIQKHEIVNLEMRNLASKESQFKMLYKLKTEHEQIKHLHPQSQQQSCWVQQSERDSQPVNKNRFKSSKSKRKIVQDIRDKNSKTQLQSDSHLSLKQRRSEQPPLIERPKLINDNIFQQKQRLYKRMKSSDEQLIEQYRSQINHLKSQIDKLVDQNTRLKKDLITKQLQNQQLKDDLKIKQSQLKSVNYQKQLQMTQTRQKQYLESKRSGLDQSNMNIPSLPNIQMISEINYLKQTLVENNKIWEKRLQEALERERKENMEAFQKIINSQMNSTPRTDKQNNLTQNLQQLAQHQSTEQIQSRVGNHRPSTSINHFPLINTNTVPSVPISRPIIQFQKNKQQKLLQKVVQQIQFLRRPYHPVDDQLKNIKDSLKGLMRRSETYGKEFKDLSLTTDSMQMVTELQNLKLYIMQEETARKNYSQEVTFYKNQHIVLSKQNKQFKQKLQELQQNFDLVSMQLSESNKTVLEQRMKLQQKILYTQQLASSLANIQSNQITSYSKVKKNLDKQRTSQLQAQVERLRSLLQSETVELTKNYDEKIRGMQHHIQNLEQKIRQQEKLLITQTQKLKQYETKLSTLTQKSNKDITLLRQANQKLQQQNISYKNQLTLVATNNYQLQTQVKERTHVIDHLWLIKQAEFENVLEQLTRLRQGF